jgi:3'-phosphoadenosine 5'-phosphosulfate sulfotransferase (PAPS reductase)/FAD synthetase
MPYTHWFKPFFDQTTIIHVTHSSIYNIDIIRLDTYVKFKIEIYWLIELDSIYS